MISKPLTLSDSDSKILTALTTEQTGASALIACGISHEYGKKRIRLLKKHGYLRERQEGQKYYYSTARLPELEHFFELSRNRSSTNLALYRFPFYGNYLTLGEAVTQEIQRTEKLPFQKTKLTFIEVLGKIIVNLKVRSFRKYKGLDNQIPDEEMMRELLGEYIFQTERTLTLAKELYSTTVLWEGAPHIWKVISEGEPNEKAMLYASDLYKGLTK
jgi:hypothetical protein